MWNNHDFGRQVYKLYLWVWGVGGIWDNWGLGGRIWDNCRFGRQAYILDSWVLGVGIMWDNWRFGRQLVGYLSRYLGCRWVMQVDIYVITVWWCICISISSLEGYKYLFFNFFEVSTTNQPKAIQRPGTLDRTSIGSSRPPCICLLPFVKTGIAEPWSNRVILVMVGITTG